MADIFENLKNLDLDEGTIVTLTYEQGTDVFHFNETEIDTALSETDVVTQLAELIATPGLEAKDSWSEELILENLRNEGLLDEYERGSLCFGDYLAETLTDNFYDVELIDHSTEKYDHKRGFTTLTATVKVSIENLIKCSPMLYGWKAQVAKDNGHLVLG